MVAGTHRNLNSGGKRQADRGVVDRVCNGKVVGEGVVVAGNRYV